jgi:glycosyltransferase involved in cell wall biosynthesis
MLRDIVFLSTADWDNPFWTNKQHVALELAKLGHRIFYIESIGLRRPSASKQDLARIWRRLRKGLRRPREVRQGLWVWSPLVLPFNAFGAVRLMNRLILRSSVGWWTWRLGLSRDLFWTYNPITTELLDLSRYRQSVYHCVDEISAQPGMPAANIERAETGLVRGVDVCFVTSEKLLASRRQLNAATYYLPNVADFAHFSRALAADTPVPADLLKVPAPRIGFVGAISGYKLDFKLLAQVAQKRPDWSIVMIGQVGEGDPWTDVSSLEGLPNIHFFGARSYSDLPGYLKGFDVAILPSAINEYTANMFPMKFFEYLAAGKRIVSTDLDALRKFDRLSYLASSPDDFIAGVENSLQAESPHELEARLKTAQDYTYQKRTADMLAVIDRHKRNA